MCGIAGIINLDNTKVREDYLQKMMDRIRHRGPNDDGKFLNNNVGLGFVRLSILDLSDAGHQPMQDDSGRYTITFNGEIFNYIELREELIKLGVNFTSNTDTEVLLKSYIQWGSDCLSKFNGMFAFVIHDNATNKIFGARDRYGIKPFYYHLSDTCFTYASEIAAILECEDIQAIPNEQIIYDFLVFNRTDQTVETFFQEIQKIPHGHYFIIEEGELQIKEWYNLRDRVAKAEPFKDEKEYKECFKSAIELRLRSDVPVGVCLSGGLDSSSIASIVVKDLNNKDLNTFSAVYNKGDFGDESEYINVFASDIKNMHYTYPSAETLLEDINHFVKLIGEPIPSLGPYAQYKVMQKAKEQVTVTLDGQGADECLAGYHYFYGFYFKDLLRSFQWLRLCKEIVAYSRIHKSLFGIKTFVYFLLPKSLRTSLRSEKCGYINAEFSSKYAKNNNVAGNLYASNS